MKSKELDNTFLRVDPLTGRKVSEACFNNKHVQGIYSTCNAVTCKCHCHDVLAKKTRAPRVEPSAPPITVASVGGEEVK